MTKNLLLALLLITTSVSASYNMAFAKATQNVKFDVKSVNIKYHMDDKLKGYFEKELPLVLNKNGITQGEEGEITIIPILMSEYEQWRTLQRKLPAGKTKKEIDDYIKITHSNTPGTINAGNSVATFVHGFSRIGSQGNASTFNGAMGNAAAQGIFMLGAGLLFHGGNALSTMSDQYLMVTDVYFGEQRTRVFAFVYSASVNESEAYESLTKLTVKKIAELASGKGEKRCDLD